MQANLKINSKCSEKEMKKMHPSVEKMVKGFKPLTMKYPCFNCPQSLKGKHNTKCEGTCELFAKYTEERKNMVSKDSWSAYNAYLK